MSFFSELTNTKPYLKAAFEGFAGCGKTFTASELAIGLHKRIGSTKPIVLFDTEKAVKFLKPKFAEAGIKVLVKESRSLADLKETMKHCREGVSDILICDSISHVWENFLQEYLLKVSKNPQYPRTRLEFQDWGVIKPTWKREFSEPFVNDPYHFIICGRAGYEYTDEKNSETGKREIFKSGVKMKVEGETAYEPDLLVLMERFEEILTENKRVWRQGTILKDRSDKIDGKTIENPKYEDFSPAIEVMLSDPDYKVTQSASDGELFRTEEDKIEFRRKCEIEREEIQGLLTSYLPGQSAQEKKLKADALEENFGTRSWTAIEQMHLDQLKLGKERLINWLETKKTEASAA